MGRTHLNPFGQGVADGRRAVAAAGAREQLAAPTEATHVAITALAANTGVVTVGGATVVAAAAGRRGTPLGAGDTISLTVDDLSDVWVDATVNGEGVSFTYLT